MSSKRAPPHSAKDDVTDLAPFHYEWRQIEVWRTVYETKARKRGKKSKSSSIRGNRKSRTPALNASSRRSQYRVTIFSLERPTRQVRLKTPSGIRTFHAIACRREKRGFIVKTRNLVPRTVHNPQGKDTSNMAKKNKTQNTADDTTEGVRTTRTKAKSRGKKKTEDEGTEDDDAIAEELAALENIADADDDGDNEADEPVEDTPKKGKKNKGKKDKSSAPRQTRAAREGKVGTNEIAAEGGTDSRTLRMVLRKHGPDGTGEIDKDPESGRWEWDSMNHRDVRKILGWLKRGEADDVKRDSLNKLKESVEARKAEKKNKKDKKGKKNKKNK